MSGNTWSKKQLQFRLPGAEENTTSKWVWLAHRNPEWSGFSDARDAGEKTR